MESWSARVGAPIQSSIAGQAPVRKSRSPEQCGALQAILICWRKSGSVGFPVPSSCKCCFEVGRPRLQNLAQPFCDGCKALCEYSWGLSSQRMLLTCVNGLPRAILREMCLCSEHTDFEEAGRSGTQLATMLKHLLTLIVRNKTRAL